MRDRRDPEEIKQELHTRAARRPPVRAPAGGEKSACESRDHSALSRGTTVDSRVTRLLSADQDERLKAAQAGLDSRAARFFSWLGSHFLGVTLVLTGVFLFWALR